ncbi:MAG: HEPN domain-containing protein [Vicinamibacterales bacterium]
MPPERADPGDPREWLRRARSNLARLLQGQVAPDVLFEDVCFDAQQAAEKALKALLVLRGRQVPRTHALSELLTIVAELGFDIPPAVTEAAALTEYAVAVRYPGPSEPVLREDYDTAVATATAVVSWASAIVAAAFDP